MMIQDVTSINQYQTQTMYVSTANAQMRVGPSTDFSSLGVMKKGTTMMVIYEINGWVSDGHVWVSGKYMKPYTDDITWKATTMVNLNCRKGPGVKYGKLCCLPKGTRLTVLKEQNNWFQVKTPYGIGWVSGQYLK